MLNNEFHFGIRSKLITPLLIGFAIFIYVIVYQWAPYIIASEKKHFVQNHNEILETLAPSVIQNILSQDYASLFSNLDYMLESHEEEWKYIEIFNSEDKRLYPLSGTPPKNNEDIFTILYYLDDAGESLGYIKFYIDWSKYKKEQQNFFRNLTLGSISLFALLIIFSFYWQTYWVIKPIHRLQNAATQLSKGKFDTKLPPAKNDEIGALSQSFSLMQDNINTYQTNLQQMLATIANEEKKQRAILESVPDGIITINEENIIQSFNPGAENIFQYTANEAIGNNIKILLPEELALDHFQHLESLKVMPHTISITEFIGKKKDGSQFPVELTLNPKIIEEKIQFTGIVRDITERQKVDRLKSEFVSTVSHELRTPLTAIKGSLDIITKGLNLNLPEQATTMLDVANRNVERLLTLINDILDVSKLESGEINFVLEKIEIKPFIKNITEMNQEYAKKYNTTFKCINGDNNVSVNADRDRLEQVMSNLLSNAAKYSPENVPVEIFTTVNDDIIRVNVKDYGPGIPEDFQDTLFEKFTQSDSGDTRQVGGTGLGLNISKMIIEKLGGRLGFETTAGKETTFYFELPVVKTN